MNDAELIIALGRAKAQLKARPQSEMLQLLIKRAEFIEAGYGELKELLSSQRHDAKEIIEIANRKEVFQ